MGNVFEIQRAIQKSSHLIFLWHTNSYIANSITKKNIISIALLPFFAIAHFYVDITTCPKMHICMLSYAGLILHFP